MKLRAEVLLRENLRVLLMDRGQTAEALAMYCGHRAPWASKILAGTRRPKITELGKIAAFFGVQVSDLFLPGASGATERRKGRDRRSGADRRSGIDRRGQCRHPLITRAPLPSYAAIDF